MLNASRIRANLAVASATLACVLISLPAAEARSPRGGGPHYQDHRPGTPIVDNRGNNLGTLHPGQTRSDLGWNGNHPRGSGNPYMPGGNTSGSAPGHYQDHRGDQAGRPRHPGGVYVPRPRSAPHYQDHRGDRGSIPIVGPQPGRPRQPAPVIYGNSAGSHGQYYGDPSRMPIFAVPAIEASSTCTYEWRRINGKRRQVKVCAED